MNEFKDKKLKLLYFSRGQSTWRPHVTPTGNVPNAQGGHLGNNIPTVTKTSLAHRRPQEEEHIGCGYNNSARPFNAVRIRCDAILFYPIPFYSILSRSI